MPKIEDIEYSLLPEGLRDGMRRYVEHGIEPGSFLIAVLDNDFMEAFKRADDGNGSQMRQIAAFIYNELPVTCWGDPETVRAWIKKHAEERAAKGIPA